MVLVLASLLPMPAAALANEFRVVPSVALEGKYNSNVFFDTVNKTRDSVAIIAPGLELIDRTERLNLNLNARGSQYLYKKETDLNSFDQFYDGTVRYSMSPKWGLAANASYWRDFQPDREILTSGLVLGRVERKHQQYGASSEHSLTEKATAVLSYNFASDNYDDDRFTDIRSHSANLGLIYDIDRHIRTAKLRGNIGYEGYTGTGIAVDNYLWTVGLMWNFNEVWQFTIDAGARYTRSSFDVQTLQFVPPVFFTVVTENQKAEGWGGVGQAAVTYKGEMSTLNFSYVRDVLPASGRSGASERNAFILDFRRRFTYELSGSFYASYFTNRSAKGQFAAAEINENTLTVGPRICYEFTKDYALEVSYSYTKVDFRLTGEIADRSLFGIRLVAKWPLFE